MKQQSVPKDFWSTTLSSFKVIVDFAPDGNTDVMFGAAPWCEEIPKGAAVDVTHRWVWIRRPDWAFGSTQVRSGGLSFPYGCSPAGFFWTLGAVAVAPLVCWSFFALPAVLSRKRRSRA